MQTIDEALEKLQASPFRAKFRLSERERAYIGEKGLTPFGSTPGGSLRPG